MAILLAKPAAVGAVSKTSRSLSRHKKTSDTKAADSAAPVTAGFGGDATSDSDEVKARDATSRSQSRKRASVFGSLLSNIQKDHDERKEERKAGIETRAEERDIKHENRKAAKAREHTLSSVEKSVVKREEREEAQEEKRALKSDGVVDPLPLDAAAVGQLIHS